MGIKNLNRFLLDNCSKKSITKIHLSKLSGKKVVIDVSIYLYKFLGENALLENMYLFISILKKYDITPIFIFDGKPPPEKKQLLIKRLIEKMEAEKKYLNIKEDLATEQSKEKKEEKLLEMELLKKQFIRIKDDDIRKVKDLFDAYGVSYYCAKGEADQLCAHLNKTEQVWGCISDDMDMFLYGCKFVIRHISLLNHTAVLYDTDKMLSDLKMSSQIFNEIMILSGTDYNINNETSLNETIKWYYEYMKYSIKEIKNNNKPYGFYLWLVKNTKYIKNYELLLRTYQMFQVDNNDNLNSNIEIDNTDNSIDFEKLYNIMKLEGFLFVK
jgi:flap endonuclease-1